MLFFMKHVQDSQLSGKNSIQESANVVVSILPSLSWASVPPFSSRSLFSSSATLSTQKGYDKDNLRRVHCSGIMYNCKGLPFSQRLPRLTLHTMSWAGIDLATWDRSRDLRITRKASWPLAHRGALFLVYPPRVFAVTQSSIVYPITGWEKFKVYY